MSLIEIESIGPRTIERWYDEVENIDFSPEYQRTSLAWSDSDKQLLIDSILNGFDITKFYLADFTGRYNALNKKGLKYAVIDGKQRLTAIFSFIENKLKLSDNFVVLATNDTSFAGFTYDELKIKKPKLLRKFDSFLLSVEGVRTDDRNLITELFLRLNKGRPLTGAELRNAGDSPANIILRNMSNHSVFKEKVKFSTARLQNFDAASKILLMEMKDSFTDTKKANLDELQLVEEAEVAELYKAEGRVISVLDSMEQFLDKDPTLSSAGLFPVIYWLVRNNPSKIKYIKQAVDFIQSGIKKKARNELINEFRLHNRNTNDKNSLSKRYDILNRIIESYEKRDYPVK